MPVGHLMYVRKWFDHVLDGPTSLRDLKAVLSSQVGNPEIRLSSMGHSFSWL